MATTRVSDIRARFEQQIAQTAAQDVRTETGGMYLAARLAKQRAATMMMTTTTTAKASASSSSTINNTSGVVGPDSNNNDHHSHSSSTTRSSTKQQQQQQKRPTTSTKNEVITSSRPQSLTDHCCNYPNTHCTKGSTEFSITSRTASGSESDCSTGESHYKPPLASTSSSKKASSSRTKHTSAGCNGSTTSNSPKRNHAKDRMSAKRGSVTQKRGVDIPQSIDEEKEQTIGSAIVTDNEELEASIVFNLEDFNHGGCGISPPRKGSMVSRGGGGGMDESEQSLTSRGSTLSRSSSQIRRLPRDMEFNSDDSSMSDDDAVGLAKHRKPRVRSKAAPKTRFW